MRIGCSVSRNIRKGVSLTLLIACFWIALSLLGKQSESVNLAMIIKLTSSDVQRSKMVEVLLRSMIKRTENVVINLHVIISGSKIQLQPAIESAIAYAATRPGVHLNTVFIDAEMKIREHQNRIQMWKYHYYDKNVQWNGRALKHKFRQDILWFHPFLHQILEVDKVIFMDTDMIMNVDIRELQAEFKHMNEGQLISIAREQTPWYQNMFNGDLYQRSYRKGTYQGLNTGVILQDLEGMRRSPIYAKALTEETAIELTKKYEMESALGSQDLLVLWQLEFPEMFHILHCSWNYQLATSYYGNHSCTVQPKIYHANGNTKFPNDVLENCC